ncbi:Tetraspanin/Peripherin [Dillenia turbinata]|uniref:Tetraspanin/Peripherin n=1 Tax=Dillenia turbinata TaxID=194707 RepID=A0AAN8VY01_9MAGN
MCRLSNSLIGMLNFITLVLSIPILAVGIWLAQKGSTDCEKFLEKPIIVIGVFLMLVSIAGLIGACCRVTWLLWVYLLVMFILIVLLFCFTVFAFVVTNKGAGDALSGKGYKEYRLGNYSDWLQKRVTNTKNWSKIKSCLVASKACQTINGGKNMTAEEFYQEELSPIQSSCCKPLDSCGFTYVNQTMWINPGNTTSTDSDCNLWSNNQNELCFNCNSCKAGLLQTIKNDWKKTAIVNIIFLIFLIIVYSVGCCAFRNNREDNAYSRWKPYAY